MRISSRGQVTIPVALRQQTGLLPNCEVDFEVRGRSVFVRRREGQCCRGEAVVRHLRGRGSIRMTTDQIMALTRGA